MPWRTGDRCAGSVLTRRFSRRKQRFVPTCSTWNDGSVLAPRERPSSKGAYWPPEGSRAERPLRPPLRPSTRVGADEPDHALAAAGGARRRRHFTVTGVARLLGDPMGGHVPNVGQKLDQGQAEVSGPQCVTRSTARVATPRPRV